MFDINLSPHVSTALTLASIYTLAMISPGPDFTMILRNSLVYSKRSGLLSALGITVSILMHASYTLFGLGLVISKSPIVFKIIQGAGACYLLYIGFISLKAKANRKDAFQKIHHKTKDLHPLTAFKNGFLSNALNPMAIMFFLSIFSTIITPNIPLSIQIVYLIEMAALAFLWYGSVALFFSWDSVRRQFLRLEHWLERLTGLVLIYFGSKIVLALIY